MPHRTHTRFVDAPGARLAVDVDGDQPRVLLCHGGPGAPDDFAEVRSMLAAWGISCARFDQRGVHRSSNDDGRWDLDAYVSDVEAVREALGAERLVILGHSWGGVVARGWAKAHPDRVAGVLLASPSAAYGTAWSAMETEVMAYLRRRVSTGTWLVVGLWSLVSMLPGRLGDRGMVRVYRHVLRAYTGESTTPDWVAHSAAQAAQRTRAALRNAPEDALDGLGLPAGVPARASFGDDDIYGPFAARFAARQRDIDTTVFEGCGHVAWHDRPEAWEAWLREGLEAAGLLDATA